MNIPLTLSQKIYIYSEIKRELSNYTINRVCEELHTLNPNLNYVGLAVYLHKAFPDMSLQQAKENAQTYLTKYKL